MNPRTNPLVHFVVDPDLLARIDDYRYAERHPSRAAAIKALITKALDAESKPPRRAAARKR